jgi:hypothetical protein
MEKERTLQVDLPSEPENPAQLEHERQQNGTVGSE